MVLIRRVIRSIIIAEMDNTEGSLGEVHFANKIEDRRKEERQKELNQSLLEKV